MKKHILITLLSITSLVFTAVAQVNYQWVKSVGGETGESGLSVVSDNKGYVYVTGRMGSSGIDFNTYGTTSWILDLGTVSTSCFVAKYDSVGNCIWAKNIKTVSAQGFSTGSSIAVDKLGNVYVSGSFYGSVDFNPDDVATEIKASYGTNVAFDAFLLKLDAYGNYKWVEVIGGNDFDLSTALVVDKKSEGIYISGTFESDIVLFSSAISDTLFNKGGSDAFLAKFDTLGTKLWHKSIGGVGNESITAIDADTAFLAVTGIFKDTLVFDTGYSLDTLPGAADTNVFLGKYMLDGSYGWMEKIGGNQAFAFSTGIALNDSHIHLTGIFKQTISIDPNNTTTTLSSLGKNDVFIAKYTIGGGYVWSTTIASESSSLDNDVISKDIAVDASGNVFLVGSIAGTISFGNLLLSSDGAPDLYFSKYNSSGDAVWAQKIETNLQITNLLVSLGSVAVDSKNNVYLTGEFRNTVDFDPGDDVANRISAGFDDMFIAKYSEGLSQITGTVTYGTSNLPLTLTGNKAQLYTQVPNDGNQAMNLVQEVDIDPNSGMYTFSELPAGTYYVFATANTTDYPNVAPIYYGNTVNWQAATSIVITETDTIDANIHMPQTSFNFNGTATLKGYVLEGSGFDRTAGDPITGVEVGLDHDPEAIIANTSTDQDGSYEFTNVPTGNYSILVYIPGLNMTASYDIHVLPTDTLREDLNFIADSASIDTIENIQSSVGQILVSKTKLKIFPNPYKNETTIEFVLTETQPVLIELYNLLGENVATLINQEMNAGNVIYKFNTQELGLVSGIYMLHLKTNRELITKKIIQTE